MPVTEYCECCERHLPSEQVPFRHSFRDGRPDMDYCRDCNDTGCDLETCDYRLSPAFMLGIFEEEGPTPEEMAEVYRAFGVEPPQTQSEH